LRVRKSDQAELRGSKGRGHRTEEAAAKSLRSNRSLRGADSERQRPLSITILCPRYQQRAFLAE
jgi:hypothetical protein